MIFNVTGGSDLTLAEVFQASEVISKMVDPDANIIFGMVTDPKMEDEVKLTLIATGFPSDEVNLEREEQAKAALSEIIEDDEKMSMPPVPAPSPLGPAQVEDPGLAIILG